MHDRKDKEAAEIQCEGIQQVQDMRQAKRLSQEIWYVQNMFQNLGSPRSDTRSDEIKLVEVIDVN